MRKIFFCCIPLLLLLGAAAPSGKNAGGPLSFADSADTSTDSILKFWLRSQAVNNTLPVHKTFWLWTSASDLDSIAKYDALLWNFTGADRQQLVYSLLLNDGHYRDHPCARILLGSDYLRYRSAWTSYWAVCPSADTTQTRKRDQLVQVNLDDSALIVVFRSGAKEKNPFSVYDLNGRMLSWPEAEKRSGHFAAVFVTGNIAFAGDKTAKRRKMPFRYFILCNEKMIRSWHHGVPGVQQQVAKDMNYLMLLHAWAEAYPQKSVLKPARSFPAAWNGTGPRMPVAEYYRAAQPESANREKNIQPEIRATIDFLRAAWRNQVKPVEKFPAAK